MVYCESTIYNSVHLKAELFVAQIEEIIDLITLIRPFACATRIKIGISSTEVNLDSSQSNFFYKCFYKRIRSHQYYGYGRILNKAPFGIHTYVYICKIHCLYLSTKAKQESFAIDMYMSVHVSYK